ncbi:MAG: energy transducer TonB [Rhodocyclaceae bacterium]
MSALLYEDREDPGRKASVALAAAVHVLLLVLLVYGVRWQTRSPEAVEVELVRAVPAPAAVAPPEPVPPPKVEPRPVPRIEPRPEPKPAPPAKPDIALKEKEKPKPKPVPKPEPKIKPKVEPKPVRDEASRRLVAEALRREQQQLDARKAEQELENLMAASARSKAVADYIGRIRGKIKGNIVLPPDLAGNPEAIFDVVQLPSGEILSVKLKKTSGHAAYDSAVERAILKSSPLPRPEQADLFSRSLELRFRPLEE